MNAMPALPAVRPPRSNVAHGRTVLVVDDYAPIRELVAWHLAATGHHVLMASGPLEAQKIARDYVGTEIDLLLTDVEMPDMRGDELAEWFSRESPRTQVIFMTASRKYAAALREARIIDKPFSLATLSGAVREALAQV